MSDEAMNNFTPRAQQVLALARKEADRFNHNFVGTEHLLLGLIKLGQGVAVNVLRRWGSTRNRPHGSRKTGRHRPGSEDDRQHPLHAPREKGPRPRRQGSQGAESHLCRHRAHPARPAARRRGRRRPRAQESRRGHRADPPGNPGGTRSEFRRAGRSDRAAKRPEKPGR